MKEKIRNFLDSDLLEKYLIGSTTNEETLKVERYIAIYPEVNKTYAELQENLEEFAKMHAVPVPEGLKEKIITKIRTQHIGRKKFFKYVIAASFTAFVCAAASVFFWNQNQVLQEQNEVASSQMEVLQKNMTLQLEDIRNQFIVLNNPRTKRFNINGNKKAKELKVVAYVNPVKKLSYINVSKLPNLPDNKCFQMWAEVNGKMVNLGIIKEAEDKDKLLALPYGENAVSYITIEPKGGNQSPTTENKVANFTY